MSRSLRGLVLLVLVALGSGTYLRAGVWTSELTLWTDATAKSPQKPRPFINLGLAQETAGHLRTAMLTHQTALALSYQPRLSAYQRTFSQIASETNLARLLAQGGEDGAALAMLDDVIASHPLFPYARWNRGVLLARTGHCDQGLPDLQLAHALEPSIGEVGTC